MCAPTCVCVCVYVCARRKKKHSAKNIEEKRKNVSGYHNITIKYAKTYAKIRTQNNFQKRKSLTNKLKLKFRKI